MPVLITVLTSGLCGCTGAEGDGEPCFLAHIPSEVVFVLPDAMNQNDYEVSIRYPETDLMLGCSQSDGPQLLGDGALFRGELVDNTDFFSCNAGVLVLRDTPQETVVAIARDAQGGAAVFDDVLDWEENLDAVVCPGDPVPEKAYAELELTDDASILAVLREPREEKSLGGDCSATDEELGLTLCEYSEVGLPRKSGVLS